MVVDVDDDVDEDVGIISTRLDWIELDWTAPPDCGGARPHPQPLVAKPTRLGSGNGNGNGHGNGNGGLCR